MKGIVLKEMPLGEADKLLTVFSEEGRISVVAKGAKKPGSRFLAAASVFALSDMELVKGKSMYIMRNAVMIRSFYGLREDYDLLTTASSIVKAVASVVQENLPDPETLELLVRALTILEDKKRTPDFTEAVFLTRLIYIQGMLGNPGEAVPGWNSLQPGTRMALEHICSAPPQKVFAFGLTPECEAELKAESRRLYDRAME